MPAGGQSDPTNARSRKRLRVARRVIWVVVSAGLAAAAIVFFVYQRDIQQIKARVASGSQVVETSYGPVEYATRGEGHPVLLVHATAGGYDQALLLGEIFLGEGFYLIAPSRPGYLRTPQADDPSAAGQADVLAALLDALEVDRAAVVAMSAGGPVAMEFALRHPERTNALVLLSAAAYAPSAHADRELPVPGIVYDALFGSDFLFWMMVRTAGPLLAASFGATSELQATLSHEEKAHLDAMIEGMLPIRARRVGLANDAALADAALVTPLPLWRIAAPTLVVQAMDDPAAVPAGGLYTAEHIPGATLLRFETGVTCSWATTPKSERLARRGSSQTPSVG
jgi:2-hydroxy-6-oxonona-2,4-dienedioate hydrolase